MVKTRKNSQRQVIYSKLLLISFLVVLLTFSYLRNYLKDQANRQKPLNFSIEKLTCINFTPIGEQAFCLMRLNTKSPWLLLRDDLPYPANTLAIEGFLQSLSTLKAVVFKSQDKSIFEISVLPYMSFYEGEILKERLYLGQRNTLKKEMYIQRASDQKIFLSPDIFTVMINQGFNYFVDLRVFTDIQNQDLLMMKSKPLNKEAHELPIKNTIIYSLGTKGWQSKGSKNPPPSANFSSLAKLKAKKVLAQVPPLYLNKPHYEIELLWSNNYTQKLLIYESPDKECFLLGVIGKPYAYLVDRATILQFY